MRSARSALGRFGQVGGVTADIGSVRSEPRNWRLAAALGAARAAQQLSGVGDLTRQHLGDVADPLAQRLGVEAVLGVVGDLLGPPTVRLVDRMLHRRGDLVGVHVHLARDVAGGTADRLDQRGPRSKEPLLVGIEDRHQRDLGQVEALAQQVDADEYVVLPHSQLAEQLNAAQRVDLGVQVPDPDAQLEQVVGEVLGHLLGESGDQDALMALFPEPDLVDQVVDLSGGRLDDDFGVDQARWAG